MGERVDLCVVGAGPAGLAAASVAAEAGLDVVVVDMQATPGGQIWRQGPGHPAKGRAAQWLDRFARSGARFEGGRVVGVVGRDSAAPGHGLPEPGQALLEPVRTGPDAASNQLPSTSAKTSVYSDLGAPISCTLEPVDPGAAGEPGARPGTLSARALLVATGARERFLPFPGWTLPGVVGVGGAQVLVKAGADLSGRTAVVAGSGPLLLEAAATLRGAGARVVGIFEQAPLARLVRFGLTLLGHPGKLVQGARLRASLAGVPYRTGSWVAEAHGGDALEGVTVSEGGTMREIACDLLAAAWGFVPESGLARLLGAEAGADGRILVDAEQRTSVPGVWAAGETTGVGGVDLSLTEGEVAGGAIVRALGAAGSAGSPGSSSSETGAPDSPRGRRGARGTSVARPFRAARARNRHLRFAEALDRAFALRPEVTALARPQTIICRCEDVPLSALQSAGSAREAKLHTRAGMGPCQARVCGPALEALFGWEGEEPRPPIHPIRIDTLIVSAPALGQERSHDTPERPR